MDELRDDLDAHVGYEPAELPPDLPIALDGEDAANKMLRRRERLARELEQVNALAKAEADRIEAWRADRADGVEREMAWVEGSLESFLRAVHRRDGITSMSLPNGRLTLRKAPDTLEVTDEAELLKWDSSRDFGDNREFIRSEPKVLRGELKKALHAGPIVDEDELATYLACVTEDGEPVPGVRLRRPIEPNFSIPKRPDGRGESQPKGVEHE